MLRIISLFLLLIISRISFAETVPATVESYTTRYTASSFSSSVFSSSSQVCAAIASAKTSTYTFSVTSIDESLKRCYLVGVSNTQSSVTLTSQNAYSVVSVPVYSCLSGHFLSDAAGNADSSGAFCTELPNELGCVGDCQSCSAFTQTLYPNSSDFYLKGTSQSGCHLGCQMSFVPSVETQATLNSGGSVTLNSVGRCTTINGEKVCTGPYIKYSGQTCSGYLTGDGATAIQAAMDACQYGYVIDNYSTGAASVVCNTDPSLPAQTEPPVLTTNPTDVDECVNGYTTGSFEGQTISVSATGCADSGDTPTDTTSGANDTSGLGSTVGGTSGATSTVSGGTSTGGSSGSSGGSDNTTSGATDTASGADDTESDCEDGDTECTGDGGGTFAAPGQGTDYLKDVFGESDLASLATDNAELTIKINQKMADVKSVFNLGTLSVSGSLAENKQEIKGASVDLSGKSLFEQLSIVSAAFYLCAIATAIYIVMGGKK